MAQLVEWSLSAPEVHGSNPYIGNFYMYYDCFEKTIIKKNRPGMAQLKILRNKPLYVVG